MKDRELQRRIERAVDEGLSFLEPTEAQCAQIARRAMAEKRARGVRMPAALVLALIMMALTMSAAAAAALLSLRQMVEQQAVPLANQTQDESYTAEDTEWLIRLAEENGITLSQGMMEQISFELSKGKGYFKEELLMALAKAEFGPDPSAWTLEEQSWFDGVCAAIGFLPEKEKAVPEGGEGAKDPVLQAAEAYIHARYGQDVPLNDPEKYKTGVQYINGDADGAFPGMYWSVAYYPQYLEGGEYWVYVNDAFQVLGEETRPGLQADAGILEVRNHYRSLYSWNPGWWSQEVVQSFQKRALMAKDTWQKAYWALARTTYPDIDPQAVSPQAAEDAALEYLHMTPREYEPRVLRMGAVYIGSDQGPVWKILLQSDNNNWLAEVDAMTGSVLRARQQPPGVSWHEWYQWYYILVLDSTLEEVENTWVDQAPPTLESYG